MVSARLCSQWKWKTIAKIAYAKNHTHANIYNSLHILPNKVIILSEQAKLAYLQEKIRNARRAIASSAQVLGIGIVLAIIGFMLSFVFIALAVIGVTLTISGGASYFYFIYQSRKLTQQLKEMACREEEDSSKTESSAGKHGKYCRYCGSLNKDDAIFCENCGKNIS